MKDGEGDIRQMEEQVAQLHELRVAAEAHLIAIQSIHECIVNDLGETPAIQQSDHNDYKAPVPVLGSDDDSRIDLDRYYAECLGKGVW